MTTLVGDGRGDVTGHDRWTSASSTGAGLPRCRVWTVHDVRGDSGIKLQRAVADDYSMLVMAARVFE
ncbi:hypothetical protein ACFZAV_22095 [Streptomyces sp. NPDC008343]|uniref:hypothetical protein n=1 Tax=Streptomyces sp. NPDC008343 TaxID=3364828 RepID=UPI0036F0A6FB